MVPLAILVGTPKAWKKEVLPGSIPVLPAESKHLLSNGTSSGWCAATTLETTMSLMDFKSPLVKMKPTLPLMNGNNFQILAIQTRNL